MPWPEEQKSEMKDNGGLIRPFAAPRGSLYARIRRHGATAAGPRLPARPTAFRRDRSWHQQLPAADRPPVQGDGFAVIDAFSRVVRLGEGLAATGRLADAAMERAVAALAVCADKLKRRNVTLARSVATEACRRAANGPEFIDRVQRETGIRLDIIAAQRRGAAGGARLPSLLEPGTARR